MGINRDHTLSAVLGGRGRRRLQSGQAAGAARAALACLLVFAAVFLYPLAGGGTAAYGAENYSHQGAPVALEASYGFDNMAKGGRYLPVYVTLTSQSEEAFEGTIRVVSMESDYNVYQYEFPVALEAGETSQQNLNIPLGVKADQLYVCLYDSGDEMVMRKRLKLNTSEDIPELLIGVISDTQDRLRYFDDVGVSYSTLRTRVCTMIAGSVPTQVAGLDQLDVLLISNYDVRRLSDDQIATIREWVNRGGVLLLGTGGRGTDVLTEFLEDNLETEPENLGLTTVDMGDGYISGETGDSRLELDSNDITLKEGTILLESDGLPLLTAVAQESGIIAAAAFDFADLDRFCAENPSYVDQMLTLLLGESRINGLSDYLYSGTSKTYWAVQGIVNAGNWDKLPQIELYAVVLVSYILLVGPGLYFFLKHRELRGYYRSGVVVLSLLCTGIIYVMSGKTRFTDTFFNYASIQDVSDTVITESTYINIQAPYNRPYTVKLDPSYTIRPVTRNAYYDAEQIPKFNGEEKPNVTIRYGEDVTRLDIQDIAAFSPSYFKLERRTDNEAGVGIEAEIQYFEGKMKGWITNNMDCRLEDTAILLYGNLALVGDMEPGETKQLDELAVLSYPVDAAAAWETAEQVTGKWAFEKADITDPDYMETTGRTSLLDFCLNDYLTGYRPGARIVAFRPEAESASFLADGEYEVSGLTMYTASAEVDMTEGDLVYRPVMMKSPKVVNGTYQASSNTISGMTPVTLEYSLGSDLEIEKLTFDTLSPVFTAEGLYNNLRLFQGSIYFYNYQEGDYTLMDSSQREYEGWQLEPYLSPGNTITVKYVCDEMEEFGDVALPILNVTGRKL